MGLPGAGGFTGPSGGSGRAAARSRAPTASEQYLGTKLYQLVMLVNSNFEAVGCRFRPRDL